MSGNLHAVYGDPTIYKKLPVRRWTIGTARNQAITELGSHLDVSFPGATRLMPLAKDVKIFREQPEIGVRNLQPSSNNSDYLALVPPPANTSIGFGALITKLNNDIEQLKKDSDISKQKVSKLQENQLEGDLNIRKELADLRAQQDDLLSWMIIGDDGFLDRIILRNLLDKAQIALAHACGLTTNGKESSLAWRSQFSAIEPLEDRLDRAKSLLQNSSLDRSIVQQFCASEHILSIILEESAIRKDGDKLAHEKVESMNMKRSKLAIERQYSSNPERSRALGLLLKFVKGYKL